MSSELSLTPRELAVINTAMADAIRKAQKGLDKRLPGPVATACKGRLTALRGALAKINQSQPASVHSEAMQFRLPPKPQGVPQHDR